MTKDEILNMQPSKKMRALLAINVMGWEAYAPEPFDDRQRTYYRDPETKEARSFESWHPDENMTDAYLVLAELAKEPFAWHIESANLKDGCVVWWVCLWGDMPDGSIAEFSAQAESIPLAVSRVALLKGCGV